MNIENITVTMKIDGKPVFLVLPQERMKILISMAQGLSDNCQLNVTPVPDYLQVSTLGELEREQTPE